MTYIERLEKLEKQLLKEKFTDAEINKLINDKSIKIGAKFFSKKNADLAVEVLKKRGISSKIKPSKVKSSLSGETKNGYEITR